MSKFQRCLFTATIRDLGCNQQTLTIFLLFTRPKAEFSIDIDHAYDGMFRDITFIDLIINLMELGASKRELSR